MTRDIPIYSGDFDSRRLSRAAIETMTEIVFGKKKDTINLARPHRIDTIFAFSNGYGYPEQARTIKKLFNAASKPVGKLILTGGMPWKLYPEQEPDLKQPQSVALLRKLGKNIPPSTLVHLETESTNTKENADYGWDTLIKLGHPGKNIAITAFNFHMGRSQRTLRATGLRHGWNGAIWLLPYKADLGDRIGKGIILDRYNWIQTSVGRSRVLGELKRIQTYGARGDLQLNKDDPEKLDFVLNGLKPL